MKKLMTTALFGGLLIGIASPAAQGKSASYFRDDMYLGLANHKVACYVDDGKIQSKREYDGFTDKNYCYPGNDDQYSPSADYWTREEHTDEAEMNSCGDKAHAKYGTSWGGDIPDGTSRTCSYNIVCDCNSDCWMKKFSDCIGDGLGVRSPCSTDWWMGCGGY